MMVIANIKYPKRKVAIVLAYLGSNYQGMQVNPNAKTIESLLFTSLVECGFISELNAVDQKKVCAFIDYHRLG